MSYRCFRCGGTFEGSPGPYGCPACSRDVALRKEREQERERERRSRPKSAAELDKEARSNEAMAGCIAKVVVVGLVIGAIFYAVNWIGSKLSAYNARKEQAAQVLREASESVDRMIAEDEAEAKRQSDALRTALANERAERAARERAEAEQRASEEKRLAAEAATAAKVVEEETKRKERHAALTAFAKSEASATWKAIEEARATASTQGKIAADWLKAKGDRIEAAETDSVYLDAVRRRNAAVRCVRLGEDALQDAFRAHVRLKANSKDATAAREKAAALARAAAVFSAEKPAAK